MELGLVALERKLVSTSESLGAVLQEVGKLSSVVNHIRETVLHVTESVYQTLQSKVPMTGDADKDNQTQLGDDLFAIKTYTRRGNKDAPRSTG